MPPFLDVSTGVVAVRALARVPAQLSTPARDRGHLARRGLGPRGRASSDGWAASGVKLRARGLPGGPAGCSVTPGWAGVPRSSLSQILVAEKRAGEL